MSNINQESTPQKRQYELDRITARYEEEYRAGRSPHLEEYLQHYPEFANELMAFALYFHAIALDLPAPGGTPAAQRSPAAEKALTYVRDQLAPPFSGFFKRGQAAGYAPPELAEVLGISWDILAKLEARAIRAASIPHRLIQRAADTLYALPESITAYLRGATPSPSEDFSYTDQAPTPQETFLDAIRSSPELSQGQKHEWEKIVEQEVTDA